MKYSELRCLIEQYEAWQRMKLRVKLSGRVPNDYLCNGQIQFASIENLTKNSSDDLSLPIVVGVGVNYAQEDARCAPHTPWLPIHPSHLSSVEDYSSTAMRAVLDETFDVYEANRAKWFERHLASRAPLIPRAENTTTPRKYFLVATNFSPFITFQEWQKYQAADRAQVLAALGGEFQHLDDLLAILGKAEVLWVGHGLGSEAFALFRQWQEHNSVPHWLLTANLSRRGSIRPAKGQTRFWERDRPEVPPFDKEPVIGEHCDE